MSWLPLIAKKLDEAVPPFEDEPLDWDGVLASSERQPAKRRMFGLPVPRTLAGRRGLLAAATLALLLAATLSLVAVFSPGRSSAARAPSPEEMWAAIANSQAFAGSPDILGIRGEFSESRGDPHGELIVTVQTRAVTATQALGSARVLSGQRAEWLALMAASAYENEALQTGQSRLHTIVTRVETVNPDGSVASDLNFDPIGVYEGIKPVIPLEASSRVRDFLLARASSLPNVKSVDISLLDFGGSTALEVHVVVDDASAAISPTINALSDLLDTELRGALIGSEIEFYDSSGGVLLYLSGSSLLSRAGAIAFRPQEEFPLSNLPPGLTPLGDRPSGFLDAGAG